ncbi:MAG: DUF4249 domain-containing protein [Candidatus Cloacimonetes bacterium]|nr:DUF4249 domain-containing protein [Candidatus Cloacimonadota bacterium]
MRNNIIYALILLTVLLLAACESFTGPERWTNGPYIVITGNLEMGRPITLERAIFVGRTTSTNGGSYMDMFIDDAEVIVRDLNDGTVDSLEFDSNLSNDGILMGYIDPDSSFIPQVGHKYRIVVNIPGEADSIWAETIVPNPLQIVSDDAFTFDTTGGWPELVWETANIEHPLRLQAETDTTTVLRFEFYCLEEWQDVSYTMSFMGMSGEPEDEDEYEDPVSGWPRKNDFFYKFQPQLHDDGNYYVIDRGYNMNIWFYGRYSITIDHIDDNYYHYLYKPEGYRHGGVHNGVGWFGSLSGQTVYTRVVE